MEPSKETTPETTAQQSDESTLEPPNESKPRSTPHPTDEPLGRQCFITLIVISIAKFGLSVCQLKPDRATMRSHCVLTVALDM